MKKHKVLKIFGIIIVSIIVVMVIINIIPPKKNVANNPFVVAKGELPMIAAHRGHRRNIAVQYWTINDADEMRELIELGCDCIMTDNPVLLKQVLEEYQ